MLDLSICIVTLNASNYLRNCLRSICEQSSQLNWVGAGITAPEQPIEPSMSGQARLNIELIIIDNGSSDDTITMLNLEFPAARLIRNDRNEGFAHPINQALHASQGQYMLLLNPDTIVLPGAINELVQFQESHPEVGICGPKVLNRDGTLQKSCRRGVSRPWAAISYFSGFSRLFPHSKFFGGYHLNYLDENEVNEVDGISGSCMLIRRQMLDQIGYLDERFFAYQEDADYCFQAKKAGWKIVYVPKAQIIHFGGQGGSRVQPYRSIFEWHRSYYLYYHKNLARDYIFLFNWFYYFLMGVKLVVALTANAFRTDKFAGPRRD
jgi:GT2 family glycosyltransferase